MKEVLKVLSEILDKNEATSLKLNYERIGDTEKLSFNIDSSVSAVANEKQASIIKITNNGLNCKAGFSIEDLAEELLLYSKRNI